MNPHQNGNGTGGSSDGFRSYYGKPVLKEPVWEPTIPAYFFFGGMAGAAAGLGLGARLAGNDSLARAATYVDAAAIAVSPPLLIADLGRPERFLNMLRLFKPTSPMSVGTWIVSVSGVASGVASTLELADRLPRTKLAAEVVAGLLGPFLSTYTAALLADTAIPVWHEARRELPLVFAGSSAASAGAACALFAAPKHARPARRLALTGAAIELAATRRMERRLGFLAEPYRLRRGGVRTLAIAAKALTAGGGLTMLLAGRRRWGAAGAGALLLAGSACGRFAIFEAGFASARNAAYTIVPQRQRLEHHPSASSASTASSAAGTKTRARRSKR